MRIPAALIPLLLAFVTGCTGEDGDSSVNPCPREPAAADRDRFVVVAHPFAAGGGLDYEVLRLGADGVLSSNGVSTFTMGKAFEGEIAFTPDGEVGLIAQDDGTVGVFRLDAAGNATVVHPGFSGGFYAARVLVDEGGTRALVVDSQTVGNGGGVYALDIGCDGSLSGETPLIAGDLPYDLAPLGGGEWVAYARSLPGAATGNDVHLVTIGDSVTVGAGVDAFPSDDDAIVYDVAVTSEGAFALVADANAFGTGNRVAVVDLGPGSLSRVTELAVTDPASIAVSPHGDAFLVTSFSGDALFAGVYDATSVTSFAELAYSGGGPQLPGNAVTITRGSLSGLTLVAENLGVRRVRFQGGGVVTDLGRVPLGAGSDSIAGAIGVQP